MSQSAYEKCSCPDEAHCGLRMLMLDVRNAITGILDRFTIADVVEVTLRKMRRDGVPLPFATAVSTRVVNGARAADSAVATRRLHSVEGLISNLLGDYAI